MTWHALPATQTPVTTRQLRPSSCFFFLIREHLMFPRLLQQTQHGAHKAPSRHPVKIQPSRRRQQPGGNQRPCPLTVTISRSSTSSPKNTKLAHKNQPRAGGEPNIYKHGAPVHTKHSNDAHEGRLCASTLPPLRSPLLRLWYLAVEKDQSGDGDGGHKQTSQKTENRKHHVARPLTCCCRENESPTVKVPQHGHGLACACCTAVPAGSPLL